MVPGIPATSPRAVQSASLDARPDRRHVIIVPEESAPAEPAAVAGIRNFAWVEPTLVARGEQPPLVLETFARLRDVGIRTVLSLRPDREPPAQVSVGNWPEYHVDEERQLVERSSLIFSHAPMADFSAPLPEELATAMRELDAHVARSPAVYVHCRAGAGRTTLVCGAWSIVGGRSGDQVVVGYQRFMQQVAGLRGFPAGEERAVY
ncbi:MAG: hypothetical protein E6I75_25045, partial [Chloroflexi bacterium]